MNLSELCQRDILTLSAEAPVRKAAEMMRTHHVGALALNPHGVRHLFITEHNGRLMGLLSLDDLKFAPE